MVFAVAAKIFRHGMVNVQVYALQAHGPAGNDHAAET